MTDEKNKLSPEEYKKVLDGVDLQEISLKESKTFVSKEARIPSDLKISVSDKSHFRTGEQGSVDLYQEYSVDARKPKSKSRYLQISITYHLRMTCKEPFTEDFFNIYKQVSLHLNTWPFFREFVHSTTARMNIPPLTLPLLKR